MSENRNDPSQLYDEEFLKKKEEFFANIENTDGQTTSGSKYEISEDDSGFEELIDDFADSDLVSKIGSKKEKKEKKKKKNKKNKVIDTPEPEYDIFELADRFGIKEDKAVKKKVKKEKKEKKPTKTKEIKAPPKPREPLKPFVPHTPVEEVKADVYVKNEELYEQQNVDIDELLKNLGIPTPQQTAAEEADTAHHNDDEDVKVYSSETGDSMVDISSVSEDMPALEENCSHKEDSETVKEYEAADPDATRHFSIPEEKPSEEKGMGATRHFNLKEYIQSAGQNMQDSQKKKAAFTQHFRFLKNKDSDETILEAAPTGKGKDSMMDSVTAGEGEDIFTAVERAQKKNKRKTQTGHNIISLKDYEEKLSKRLKDNKTNLILLAVMTVISAVLTVPFSAYGMQGAHHGLIYSLINIIAVAVVGVIARKEMILGFNNIRYLSPDQNSVTFIAGVFVLLFNIIAAAFGTLGVNGVKPYTVCFAFAALVRIGGEYFDDLTAMKSVKTLSQKKEYEGIRYVSSKNDALAIAHGLSEKNIPTILYAGQSDTAEGIREDKAPGTDEEKYYSFVSMAVLIVGFVAGIILFVRNKDAVSFITALTACICFCLPLLNEFLSSVFFFDSCSRLSEKGAAVNDVESLEILSKAKAICADAKELFSCEVSSFKRIKGAFVSKSDAAVFVAATLKAGGSLAGECFDDFVNSLDIVMPEAEDIQYEEKLGFSCWIADRRVLVGNRQMLVEHSIDAPTQAEEKAYAGKKNVMYLALEGQLVASFLVRYKAEPSFKKIAGDFDRTGLVLMVNSAEPCLDEENCAARLGIDVASVKILSQKAAGLVDSYKSGVKNGKATALVRVKKGGSILSLAVGAHKLYQGDKLISNLLLSGQGVAMILIFLSVILNMPVFFNPFTIIALQALWCFMSFAIVSDDFRNTVRRKLVALIAKGRKSK